MASRHILFATSVAVTALIADSVYAQTPPDAGSLQQQIDRERQQQLPKRMSPEKPAVPAAMQPVSGVVVTVREFRFAGNTLLPAEKLAPIVADYLNRPLDFAQLNAAAAAVAEVYREAGWTVRAYLPAQDIKDGIVTIQIVEAVFGKLKIEGALPQRMVPSQIEAIFARQQQGGDILNNNALDRALLIADDLPGVTAAGSLAAGASERETDLILKLADEPLIVGEVTADNTGSRSTGSDRLTANLNVTSPFGFGDLLTSNLIHTVGSDYVRVGYTIPVGSDGWRIGMNTSHLDYRLTTNAFKALDPTGTSDSSGIEATYPILRSRQANLYLNLNYDRKRFDNQSGGNTATRYSIDETSIALNGNLFDNWGGGGANSATLTYVTGARDNSKGSTDQRFEKLRYSLSRQQVITSELSFYAQLSGQKANKDLDSSETFYLGGANGVRAYPSSEAGGHSGMMTNLELRWKVLEELTLTAFHDYGHISVDDLSGGKSYGLKGTGLSVAWQTPPGVNLKLTWAHRLGHNPNWVANHDDRDDSGIKNRYWLSASLPF